MFILYTMSRTLLILTLLKAQILSPAGSSGDDQYWLRVKRILLALSGLAAAGFGSGPRIRQAMMVIQRARLFFSCSAVPLAGTEMGLNKSLSRVQRIELCSGIDVTIRTVIMRRGSCFDYR